MQKKKMKSTKNLQKGGDENLMDIKKIIVDKKVLENVVENIKYNKTVIEYYDQFSKDSSIAFGKDLLSKKGERLGYCNHIWKLDKYAAQKIKDFKKTNLCHDKFCANCKKVVQAGRMAKYIPELEKYKNNLYHLTLTVPNCPGPDLKFTYKKMAKSFKMLTYYLTGYKKIKGVNFERFGYEGAIRSLEVTFKKNSYHPHFHVGLVLNTTLHEKKILNTYSYNYNGSFVQIKRLFSKEEILIQKVWYLLINNIKVTKEAINELEVGYSCTLDKFKEDDFAELFKYISKGSDESGNILSYDNFINLYYGLFRVKQIQGYGCLYKIDDNIDLEELDNQYNDYIQEIAKKEDPLVIYEEPKDLILDSEYTLISRKAFFKYLRLL